MNYCLSLSALVLIISASSHNQQSVPAARKTRSKDVPVAKQLGALHFVETSEPSASSFESSAHYRYLYDGTTRVSRIGQADISPSGKYVAFEDFGKIMLYNCNMKTLKDITDGKFALPEKFKWDESKALLFIEYYNDNRYPASRNHPMSTIHLAE